jgi:ADP-ribose pyrophosphatase YjhB (NUDIX family)
MKHSRSVGGVVVSTKGQILVVSQHGTSWSLIKGTVEEGEDDKTTALREFKEESGITKVEFIRKLGTYERHVLAKDGNEDTSQWKTITFYLCTTPEEVLKPEDPHNPEAVWVDPRKVTELLTHPKDKEFYESVKQQVIEFIEKKTN